MKNSKVVYLHRKQTDNSIFYVGVGNLKRAYSKQRPDWWQRVVKKYGYTIEIYKSNLTQEEAFQIEIELIAKYGRIDLGNGQLINQTKGGITVEGVSEKVLNKKKKSLKSVVRTQEWKDKISISHKGKVKSKEHRENIAKSLIGKKIPENVRQKMKQSNKSKIITAVKIACYDYYSGEFVSYFESVRDASKKLGCGESSISNHLHNRSHSFKSKKLNKRLKCKKI